MKAWALGSLGGHRVRLERDEFSVLSRFQCALLTEVVLPPWGGPRLRQCSLGYSLQPMGILRREVQSTLGEQRASK